MEIFQNSFRLYYFKYHVYFKAYVYITTSYDLNSSLKNKISMYFKRKTKFGNNSINSFSFCYLQNFFYFLLLTKFSIEQQKEKKTIICSHCLKWVCFKRTWSDLASCVKFHLTESFWTDLQARIIFGRQPTLQNSPLRNLSCLLLYPWLNILSFEDEWFFVFTLIDWHAKRISTEDVSKYI